MGVRAYERECVVSNKYASALPAVETWRLHLSMLGTGAAVEND